MSEDQTKKGCFNCRHKKNLDDIHYKCTEKYSQPNLSDSKSKFTGFIKDVKEIITLHGHAFMLGCSCEFWTHGIEKEIVKFT